MRKILISAALISAAAMAAPASAQYGGWGYNSRAVHDVRQDVHQLHQRIDGLFQRRLISHREMRSLHEQAERIDRRAYDYARNGLTSREHRDLRGRLQNMRERLQRERYEGRRDRRHDRRW
jgi:hypothetical protein